MTIPPLKRPLAFWACCFALVGTGLVSMDETQAQTYRKTWTLTGDFAEGSQVNVEAESIRDQLQLDLSGIETPYFWIANSGDRTVSRIETATGRVLSVTDIPGFGPSRTAVDIDFNAWVALRADARGITYKLDASDGSVVTQSLSAGGEQTRGVVINSVGEVWVSSSKGLGSSPNVGWVKFDPNVPSQALQRVSFDIGSYGLAAGPFGEIFSTSSWLPEETQPWQKMQRVDSITGALEQEWGLPEAMYGITVDIENDVWGTFWPSHEVVWIDGDYECPGGAVECDISLGSGILARIDVRNIIQAAGGSGNLSGRGIAFDANRFIWAVFNDLGDNAQWENSRSYAVKIDGTTGEPILAVYTGQGSVGISPDADGFIWVVNYNGGGANFVEHECPNGFDPNTGGTITKLRSSDGSVVATYPTCGNRPYTYSDYGGYGLRSVTLRSGSWRVVHDSGRPGLQWERSDWISQDFDDTTLRLRARAADTRDALSSLPFVDLTNGGPLPIQGQFIEIDAFFFTQNDFIGPVLEEFSVSSVCIQSEEICDGFDNDCDGVIDNGNPGGGQACSTDLEGICSQGERVCVRGEYECQSTLTPQEETCDGLDNNCNGRVDEGVSNRCGGCGPLPEEVCDGEDNDCDGQVDEAVLNICGTCGPVPEETCNGVDDNCNGLIDEEVLNACDTCGPTPDEICNGDDDDCDGIVDEGVTNACGTCGPAPEEICNGIDDNCNGLTDEELINACGTCGPVPEEECNGVDDNCNGEIDEGVTNACGTCGAVDEEVCDTLDNDCDGEIDEGVTNACGGCGDVLTETCDGIDNDCDGEVDEGVVNACGGCGLLPEEICDNQDNDCDGEIDEAGNGQTLKNACGTCGALPPDVCDGVDSDCDGEVDEDPECAGDRACREGQCAEPCTAGECALGFVCIDDYCILDECVGLRCQNGESCFLGECVDNNELVCRDVECEGEQVCIGGTCVDDPCETTTCEDGESCWLGDCLPEDEVLCKQANCGPGEVCNAGACEPDPCNNVTCNRGEECFEGICQDACLFVSCSPGFDCREGVCVADPCQGVTCEDNQVCDLGNCVWRACVGVVCEEGEQCGENGCVPLGTCGDSVCSDGEVCINDQCVEEGQTSGGTTGDTSSTGTGGTSSDTSGGGNDGGDGGSGGDDEGCGCTSVHTPNPLRGWMVLVGLLGFALIQVRRRKDR